MLRTHKSRSVVKFDLGFESKTVVALILSSLWKVFFLQKKKFVSVGSSRAFVANPWVGHLFVTRYMHRSLSAVSSVKQVSHSWHVVLDTDTLYTFLNFITQFISLLNLHLEPELIIVNIDIANLHSVYRSLEIHNCALTSSWERSQQEIRHQSGTVKPILWSASRRMC